MSANFVSKTHIDALLTAALQYADDRGFHYHWHYAPPGPSPAPVTRENADTKGQMLWSTNFDATIGWMDAAERLADLGFSDMPTYRFEELPGDADPLTVVSLTGSYGYQTGDEPDVWYTSEANALVTYLEKAALARLLRQVPELPWLPDDNDRNLFLKRVG